MAPSCLTVILWLFPIICSGYYFPTSTKLETCCSDPVKAFIMREFSGPCACMTLQHKWKRYVDWVQIEGGYIHPWIELSYVHRYQDSQPSKDEKQSNTKHKTNINQKPSNFKMHSHERGMFVNIRQKYQRKIKSKAVLMQIPFSISFSQLLISKYIQTTTPITKINNPPIKDILFQKPDHFLPSQFPDWDEFQAHTTKQYGIDSIRGWLALGLAWLKQNTHELLPWFALLPQPYYLPITWDKFLRDEFLLTGTRALNVVHQLEREYSTARPYIELLGLTEMDVREAFAWISSRSFGMSLDKVGGAKRSPVIPCGIDFFNHNIFGDSSIYYDSAFGAHRFLYDGHVQNQQVIENLVLEHKPDGIIREIDFASNFLWVNADIANTTEIFVNYGKRHTSASRLALFGFIDEIHPYDHYSVRLTLLAQDENEWFKQKYFKTEWNSTYTQQNKTKLKPYEEDMCYVTQFDSSSWYKLGKTLRKHQSMKSNSNKYKLEQRVYAPPLKMEYYGQHIIKVYANFLRFLRLAYLPPKYFDSFTISAILNDFEYDYLSAVIDPYIVVTVNDICKNLLDQYPSSYGADQMQLKQIEQDRQQILKELELNMNKNLTKTQRLTQIVTSLDRHSVVLQYRVREKSFLDKCSRLTFEPTQKYLNSVKRRKAKFKSAQKKKKQIMSADHENSIGFEELLSTLNFSSFLPFNSNPRQNKGANTTVNGGNNSNVSFATQFFNISQYETNGADINYVELLKQIAEMLVDSDIDIEIFADFDETAMHINNATQPNVENHDVDDMLDDSEHIGGDIGGDMDGTPSVVSKRKLVIGHPKKAKQVMAETFGWNSPTAGLGSNVEMTFTNIDGEPFDLTALFGGRTSFTLNGANIQVTSRGTINF